MPFLRGRTLCNQHQDKQTTPHRAIREPVVARTSENGVVIVARASAPCRTSALTNSSGRKISRPSVTRIGEQAGLPPTPRDAWSRSYAVANLFRRIQIFLAEMPGSAPTYKRECNVRRTQTGGIRRSPGDVAVASSRRHPIGHLGYSAATPVTGFSALCRLREQSYVVGSTQHSPVTALMRRFARTSRRRCLRTTAGECAPNVGKARPSLIFER
ncbi:MAG: hypothetical protein QOG66_1327 [Methylobacteriaceae bacterium]|jgi:hypothetical protein|nr:hypothetical protein [Methylobacteriaceae bacterium]